MQGFFLGQAMVRDVLPKEKVAQCSGCAKASGGKMGVDCPGDKNGGGRPVQFQAPPKFRPRPKLLRP